MKQSIIKNFKSIINDRTLLAFIATIVSLVVIYIIYVSLRVTPTELQIATRYTSFSDAQYYKEKWHYLLTFIGFIVIVAATNIGLILKLNERNMRPLAFGFAVLTIVVLVVSFIITRYVLNIAYLS